MRFERESWRKLYVAESPEHQLMSLATRGIRDYLLRFAEPDGTILRESSDVIRDLCKILRAEPSERKQVAAALKDLIRVGYISLDSGTLKIAKFLEAQLARSKSAERQARFKEKKRKEGQSVTSNAQGNVTGNASGDNTDNAPETLQRDETRRDEKDPPNPQSQNADPTADADPDRKRPPDPLRDTFDGKAPGQRSDTNELLAEFADEFEYSNMKFIGPYDPKAKILAEKLDNQGMANCKLVVKFARFDGMVSGKTDEKGTPHQTIEYIFGNDNAFHRILRAALKATSSNGRRKRASDAVREAQQR